MTEAKLKSLSAVFINPTTYSLMGWKLAYEMMEAGTQLYGVVGSAAVIKEVEGKLCILSYSSEEYNSAVVFYDYPGIADLTEVIEHPDPNVGPLETLYKRCVMEIVTEFFGEDAKGYLLETEGTVVRPNVWDGEDLIRPTIMLLINDPPVKEDLVHEWIPLESLHEHIFGDEFSNHFAKELVQAQQHLAELRRSGNLDQSIQGDAFGHPIGAMTLH